METKIGEEEERIERWSGEWRVQGVGCCVGKGTKEEEEFCRQRREWQLS